MLHDSCRGNPVKQSINLTTNHETTILIDYNINQSIHQSINQVPVLFTVGDHDLPRISIPRRFQRFCPSSYFEPLCLSNPTFFSRCFSLPRFPSIFSIATRCSRFRFPLLITWSQKVTIKKRKITSSPVNSFFFLIFFVINKGRTWRLKATVICHFTRILLCRFARDLDWIPGKTIKVVTKGSFFPVPEEILRPHQGLVKSSAT